MGSSRAPEARCSSSTARHRSCFVAEAQCWVLFDSGLTYYARRGLLLRAERRSVAWDAIAQVTFQAIPRGGRAMIIAERPESHGGRRLPDLRVNLGFLDISSGLLVDRMNELAMAKGSSFTEIQAHGLLGACLALGCVRLGPYVQT